MAKVGIVDYGLGNLRSVAGAVERLGHFPLVSSERSELATTDKLVLPGVGAFGDGMKNLRSRQLSSAIMGFANSGKPMLGICLGFQLLAKTSEEFGTHEGLGLIEAKVERLSPHGEDFRVPHVGWNGVDTVADCILFEGIPDDALFYYVHSFQLVAEEGDVVAGTCDYGGKFVSAIAVRNVFGVQFHPEKSQQHGLTLLSNFIEHA